MNLKNSLQNKEDVLKNFELGIYRKIGHIPYTQRKKLRGLELPIVLNVEGKIMNFCIDTQLETFLNLINEKSKNQSI